MIRTIHFGRMIILRPEQYLVYSDVPRVEYDQTAKRKVPKPFEDYVPLDAPGTTLPTFRSWLLTLVEFDGDIRVYFRDIAQFIADDFDALVRIEQLQDFKRRFEEFVAKVRPGNGTRTKSMDDLFDQFLSQTQYELAHA